MLEAACSPLNPAGGLSALTGSCGYTHRTAPWSLEGSVHCGSHCSSGGGAAFCGEGLLLSARTPRTVSSTRTGGTSSARRGFAAASNRCGSRDRQLWSARGAAAAASVAAARSGCCDASAPEETGDAAAGADVRPLRRVEGYGSPERCSVPFDQLTRAVQAETRAQRAETELARVQQALEEEQQRHRDANQLLQRLSDANAALRAELELEKGLCAPIAAKSHREGPVEQARSSNASASNEPSKHLVMLQQQLDEERKRALNWQQRCRELEQNAAAAQPVKSSSISPRNSDLAAAEVQNLRHRVWALERELQQCRRLVAESQTEAERARERHLEGECRASEAADRRVAALERSQSESEHRLESMLTHVRAELRTECAECDSLRSAGEDLRKQLERRTSSWQNAEHQLESARRDDSSRHAEFHAWRREMEAARSDESASLAKARAEARCLEKSLQEEERVAARRCNLLGEELAASVNEAFALRQGSEDLSREVDSVRQQLFAARHAADLATASARSSQERAEADCQREALASEREAAVARRLRSELAAQAEAAEDRGVLLERSLSKARARTAQWQTACDDCQEELTDVQAELSACRAANAELIAARAAAAASALSGAAPALAVDDCGAVAVDGCVRHASPAMERLGPIAACSGPPPSRAPQRRRRQTAPAAAGDHGVVDLESRLRASAADVDGALGDIAFAAKPELSTFQKEMGRSQCREPLGDLTGAWQRFQNLEQGALRGATALGLRTPPPATPNVISPLPSSASPSPGAGSCGVAGSGGGSGGLAALVGLRCGGSSGGSVWPPSSWAPSEEDQDLLSAFSLSSSDVA